MMIMLSHIDVRMQEKIFNYPGFFEGVVEARCRFAIVNEEWYLVDWKKVEIFLRSFNVEGLSVNGRGKLVNVVFPFQNDEDIELVKYFFSANLLID